MSAPDWLTAERETRARAVLYEGATFAECRKDLMALPGPELPILERATRVLRNLRVIPRAVPARPEAPLVIARDGAPSVAQEIERSVLSNIAAVRLPVPDILEWGVRNGLREKATLREINHLRAQHQLPIFAPI